MCTPPSPLSLALQMATAAICLNGLLPIPPILKTLPELVTASHTTQLPTLATTFSALLRPTLAMGDWLLALASL